MINIPKMNKIIELIAEQTFEKFIPGFLKNNEAESTPTPN